MLDLATYRLLERGSSPGTFEFVEPQTGRVVGVASPVLPGPAPQPEPNRRHAILGWLSRFRFFQVVHGLVSLPILVARILLGRPLLPPKESRPRLVVRRPGDGDVVFTLRTSSGFMYDSRRVYDGQGGLIAQFRGRPKTTVRGGFDIVDLRGMPDDWSDIGARPWLGVVEPAGDTLRVRLVGHRDAARIALHEPPRVEGVPPQPPSRTSRGDCAVDVAAELRDDPTSQIVVLAAVLTLAWWPPG